MAIEAAQTQYRQAMIDQFEARVSMLRNTATKETVTKGNTATFLVAGSGTDTAVSRGTNGLIPFGNPTNSQVSATLVEKHAPYELTGFNVFASQGDQLAVMRQASMSVINRDIDDTFITELGLASIDTGSYAPASLAMVEKSKAYLGNQNVPIEEEENMFAVISPGFRAYLMQTTEFSNGLYVDSKPFGGPTRKVWRWDGVNWIVSSRLSGLGTSTEKNYIYHRAAIGYSVNIGEDSIAVDYDKKQDISWSRATIFHAAKILQNTGIVEMRHDASAFGLT